MRSDAQRSLALLPDGTKRFVLLIAGAWIAGLVIFLLLGIALPATSASHGADGASPSSDLSVMTAGHRWADPGNGGDVGGDGSADVTLAVAGDETHRWVPAVAPPVELAGHRWVPAVAPPEAITAASRA